MDSRLRGSDEQEPEHEVDNLSPATKADISALAVQVYRRSQGNKSLAQALQGLMSKAGWIWWFSLGALVASLKHFCAGPGQRLH